MEDSTTFGIEGSGGLCDSLRAMIAKTLHCYSCGAAVSSDKPKCGHCGARLATVSCPTCFGMMFQGSKFCPSCGGAAATWHGKNSKRLCPACETSMLKGDLHGIPLHECTKCLGLWLDAATFERICRDAEQQATVLGNGRSMGAANAIGTVRYLRCPQCRDLMHRVNFARCSGVIVDVCRSHGTWFDVNELHRIVHFIREGGMTRSREKERSELAEERRRLNETRLAPEVFRTAVDYSSASSYGLIADVVCASADLLTSFLDQ